MVARIHSMRHDGGSSGQNGPKVSLSMEAQAMYK